MSVKFYRVDAYLWVCPNCDNANASMDYQNDEDTDDFIFTCEHCGNDEFIGQNEVE